MASPQGDSFTVGPSSPEEGFGSSYSGGNEYNSYSKLNAPAAGVGGGGGGGVQWKPSLERLFPSEENRLAFSDSTPNIMLCGLSRAGKSSICKVVFNKTSPHETLYFQPNQLPDVVKVASTNLVKFTLIDIPGNALLEPQYDDLLLPRTQTIVFVIDAQNEPYTSEIAHAKDLFRRAWEVNPRINLEVFIHKVDGDFFAVDEVRAECQRDIHDKLMSHLHEEGVSANVVFYSTSIYDHTILEACSRVVQRLIPQAPTLELMLDLLVANCRMEKAFLIDVLSKTFIATDSSPFDPFNYELCTDMIEVVIEMSCIYGEASKGDAATTTTTTSCSSPAVPSNMGNAAYASSDGVQSVQAINPSTGIGGGEEGYACDIRQVRNQPDITTSAAKKFADSSAYGGTSVDPTEGEGSLCEQFVAKSPLEASERHAKTTTQNSQTRNKPPKEGACVPLSDGEVTASSSSTMCLIQLNTGHILYLREIDRLVALACVIREENFDRQYLVDYNIKIFCDAVLQLFNVRRCEGAD